MAEISQQQAAYNADKEYYKDNSAMSVSFYKKMMRCEAEALAEKAGMFTPKSNEAMLIGSYVDNYISHTLNPWLIDHHDELYTKKGLPRELMMRAASIVSRISQDKTFMEYMKGDKQHELNANLFGVPWKGKTDVITKDRIVDLKVVSTFDRKGSDVSFIEAWGYDLQLAVYQAMAEAMDGKHRKCYIAAVTKEEPSDLAIIEIPQEMMDARLIEVKNNIDHIWSVWNGDEQPFRCEQCDYCRGTKKAHLISIYDLGYSTPELMAMKEGF